MIKGLIPITLGLGVTAAGIVIKKRTMKYKYTLDLASLASSSLCGFGAAHILLGAIDLIKDVAKEE